MVSTEFSGELVNEIPTGKIVIKYSNGKKNGMTRFIASDGRIQTEIPYLNDEIHGELRQYYDSGGVMSIITYMHNEQTGPMSTFFENGMKQLVTAFAAGKIHGPYTTYDEYGDTISEAEYVNGVRHGRNLTYYPKIYGGGLYELSYYDNGLLEGDKVTFYETGEIMATTPYVDGKAQAYPRNFSKTGEEIH
ncbi:MAG: hypothetical protein LBF56_01675 [Holosporales bacterium]|jgi:antitoxin component YwqK of YwqJK toxin-antitoxin module|nr:hypothetical protein [Holosporales bacterium]